MAGVNVELNASTQKYLNEIKKAQSKGNKSFEDMSNKAKDMGDEITGAFDSPTAAINGFLGRLGPVGVGIGAIGAVSVGLGIKLASMGAQVMEAQKQLEKLANQNNMSVEDMNKYSIAVSAAGMDTEKFSDILKDVNDKVGNFLADGGGGMANYFTVIQGKIKRTADDFRGLSSLESLRLIQSDLDAVGASTAEQTFALEALASDASGLSGVLRMSEQDIDNMLQGYALKRASLSKQTMDDISKTQANMDTLSNNFNAALAESMNGLISLAGEMSKSISNTFYSIAQTAKGNNVATSFFNGGKVTKDNANDVIEFEKVMRDAAGAEAAKRAKADERWSNNIISNNNPQLLKEYQDQVNQSISDGVALAKDLKAAGKIQGQNTGVSGDAAPVSISSTADAEKRLQELGERRKAILVEQGKWEVKLRGDIGENEKKAIEEQISNQKTLLKTNDEQTKAATEQLHGYQSAAQAKALAETQKAAQMRSQALQATLKTELDIENFAHQEQLKKLDEYRSQGALTETEYNTAIEIAEQKHQDRLVKIQENAANEKKRLAEQEYQDRLAAMNLIKNFSTDIEQQANQELLIRRAQVEREFELDQQRGTNAILSETDKNNKLAEIDREYEAQKTERELANAYDREQANVTQAETERLFLQEQYANKVIDKEEYDRLIIESDTKVATATRDLAMKRLGTMSEMFKGAAALAKEGSKQQKALFAMEKASTIASMSLSMYEQWGKAKTWSDKAMVFATFVPQIASATAVTLGQFHDGTDYVEGTGSYYLQQGERVVNTDTNKDLTAYLKSNGSKDSGQTVINADLIIQGDASGMDEQKFKEYAMVHRDMISDAIRQSNMERGIS